MKIQLETVDVSGEYTIRCSVVRPKSDTVLGAQRWPMVLMFSDIFGNTDSHLRAVKRIASYGYLVVSPEPWAALYPPGTVFDFTNDRTAALAAQEQASIDAADSEIARVISHFSKLDVVDANRIFCIGFCFGGHTAFRAALHPALKAVVACYATGVHANKLGGGYANTVHRFKEIRGELLVIWGVEDPHVPAEGRNLIHRRLDEAAIRWESRLFDAAHAFMRDVGPRYDPEATDRVVQATLSLFSRS